MSSNDKLWRRFITENLEIKIQSSPLFYLSWGIVRECTLASYRLSTIFPKSLDRRDISKDKGNNFPRMSVWSVI